MAGFGSAVTNAPVLPRSYGRLAAHTLHFGAAAGSRSASALSNSASFSFHWAARAGPVGSSRRDDRIRTDCARFGQTSLPCLPRGRLWYRTVPRRPGFLLKQFLFVEAKQAGGFVEEKLQQQEVAEVGEILRLLPQLCH